MLTLINTNRMTPAIGPLGLDYIACAVKQAGFEVEVLDLCFEDDPVAAIKLYFRDRNPELVGISFRNADDSFWPSADWFVPELKDTIEIIHSMSEAPVVIGGIGYSIFPKQILHYTGADFGLCGDGEGPTTELLCRLKEQRKFDDVPGLLWHDNGKIRNNTPAWPKYISLNTARNSIDNLRYFRRGGQCGLETKRGCNRSCIYCADPLAKGNKLRLRNPSEIADEVQSLLAQNIDVLHLCDAEFNIPRKHAMTVCEELINRSLGDRIRWYAYLSPVPFDQELARMMARAGCVGINFTGDSGCEAMLRTYRQKHDKDGLAKAVKLCRLNNIAVMVDLLLGGPGETRKTTAETIDFIRQINPDCAGASLGVRVYPHTVMEVIVKEELNKGHNKSIRRKYDGPVDLFKPTFYISGTLGERPAELVRDLIAGDQRFFEPALEAKAETATADCEAANYNYNENVLITKAIANGARGAYWDILRGLRNG